MRKLLNNRIPNDHTNQVNPTYYVDQVFKQKNVKTVLDLGCGDGRSLDQFKMRKSDIVWVGLDILSSPEVDKRARKDKCFVTYDGVNLPFTSNVFDLIYSNQAFEHIQYPRMVLKEVHRILKPGGFFIGSTSHLEPYHSRSFWNFTPYGFSCLIEETGLQTIEIRPGIDCLTLIVRSGFLNKNFTRYFSRLSLLNHIIQLFGKIVGLTNQQINHIKLVFCGQFCFMAKKI